MHIIKQTEHYTKMLSGGINKGGMRDDDTSSVHSRSTIASPVASAVTSPAGSPGGKRARKVLFTDDMNSSEAGIDVDGTKTKHDIYQFLSIFFF